MTRSYHSRETIVGEAKKILEKRGVMKLRELWVALGYQDHRPYGNPYTSPEIAFSRIMKSSNFHIFKLNIGVRRSHGGIKYGGTALFDGFVSGKYVCLKGDVRLIDFVANTIPKPLNRIGRVRALRHRLNLIFGKEIARKIIERAGYTYRR